MNDIGYLGARPPQLGGKRRKPRQDRRAFINREAARRFLSAITRRGHQGGGGSSMTSSARAGRLGDPRVRCREPFWLIERLPAQIGDVKGEMCVVPRLPVFASIPSCPRSLSGDFARSITVLLKELRCLLV